MFELNFSDKIQWAKESDKTEYVRSKINIPNIDKTMLIKWEEHCLECAVPECYSTCQLYSERLDGACARFTYGIYPNNNFSGLFNFGADVRFKRWAKLEADLQQFSIPVRTNIHKFSQLLSLKTPKIFSKISKIYINKKSVFSRLQEYDDFVVECYSDNKESFNLILECYDEEDDDRKITFRRSFNIKKGLNNFSISTDEFIGTKFRYIYLYPENDLGVRIIFTWLDFVKYKKNFRHKPELPAPKVKCVAWDLDNTLWEGILVESDPSLIYIKSDVIRLIKSFDERGIIQTIVSKNDHDLAIKVLKQNKISDYFIYPAINWGQKSNNLSTIAKNINIDLNTFALIDDSEFERFEVKNSLPQVRIFPNTEINDLLSYPEFDVPITETSRIRRKSYMSQITREKVQANFAGDYDQFLKSCDMKMEFFVPNTNEEKNRCVELIQRSNQLNLSGKKYSTEEFEKILDNPDNLVVAINCSDKFGKYGIVGVANNNISGKNWILTDFVLSCRVAQKKVEHHIFQWFTTLALKQNKKLLLAQSVPTTKNGPLLKVFKDMGFDKNKQSFMSIEVQKQVNRYDLIQIKDKVTRKQ